MIDLQQAQRVFKEYVEQFDRTQEPIDLKYVHSVEVMKVMDYLADVVHLPSDLHDVACLIGLLHDYGRFEQWYRYKNFSDAETIDHADFSVYLLFDEGHIRHYIDDTSFDEMIKSAIQNHNKYAITGDYDEMTLLMCQMVRDADKIDNFRVREVMNIEVIFGCTIDEINHQTITPAVYEQFIHHQLIRKDTRKTRLDVWLSHIAFIFDLNIPESLEYIKRHDYINHLFDMMDPVDEVVHEQYMTLKQAALDYAYK